VASQPTRFPRTEGEGPPGPREARWSWLLIVPLLGTLFPFIYNTNDPELIGIPFFYWYQMLWIPISVLCTLVVYTKTRREPGR
jgi:Protein of unknown function (DUF3311)